MKAYGVGMFGMLILVHGPFLEPGRRLELLNDSGGVVQPKWINFSQLTREDKGIFSTFKLPRAHLRHP